MPIWSRRRSSRRLADAVAVAHDGQTTTDDDDDDHDTINTSRSKRSGRLRLGVPKRRGRRHDDDSSSTRFVEISKPVPPAPEDDDDDDNVVVTGTPPPTKSTAKTSPLGGGKERKHRSPSEDCDTTGTPSTARSTPPSHRSRRRPTPDDSSDDEDDAHDHDEVDSQDDFSLPAVAILSDDPDFLAPFSSRSPTVDDKEENADAPRRRPRRRAPPSYDDDDVARVRGTEREHMRRLRALSDRHLSRLPRDEEEEEEDEEVRTHDRSLADELTAASDAASPRLPEMTHRNVRDDQHRKARLTMLTRSALSRPFNRTSLPAHLAKKWHVDVSEPEVDPRTHQHVYSVSVREESSTSAHRSDASPPPAAMTRRTLEDFRWLERALRHEYHGALLTPVLPAPKSGGDPRAAMDEKVLREWLSDVLNGVRGQGELILRAPDLDLLSHSESVETFLYRRTDPAREDDRAFEGVGGAQEVFANPDLEADPANHHRAHNSSSSSQPSLLSKSLMCLVPPRPSDDPCPPDCPPCENHHAKRPGGLAGLLGCTAPSSRSSPRVEPSPSSSLAEHSELIAAEARLLRRQRAAADECLSELRALLAEETHRNNAWRRLAIFLYNLYAFEKDVESASEGGADEDASPRRSPSKNALNDGLRVLSRQKVDRANHSLVVLNGMLQAYAADLAAVGPSVAVYHRAVEDARRSENDDPDERRGGGAEALRTAGRRWLSYATHEPRKDAAETSSAARVRRAAEARLAANEVRLKRGLHALIRSVPVRTARMAWKYFKMEANQANSLSAAASRLRAKLRKRRERRRRNAEDDDAAPVDDDEDFRADRLRALALAERRDDALEADLVRRILALRDDDPAATSYASALSRERVGRWNAPTALAVLEAAGVRDAEVRAEETTRDLRAVRRRAIGLRDRVERCAEAVAALAAAAVGGDAATTAIMAENVETEDVEDALRRTVSLSECYEPSALSDGTPRCRVSRERFWRSLALVFSGSGADADGDSSSSSSPSRRSVADRAVLAVLAKVGVDADDPVGWLDAGRRGHCGGAASAYAAVREGDVASLLSRVARRLREYGRRVEGLESHVYLHCVGIQLEKHFARSRAELVEAWEKKTDIETAINIADRKRLPHLVEELRAKLDHVRHASRTAVKTAKERHLASKRLKTELGELADRRYRRAKETATDRVAEIVEIWAAHEEAVAAEESRTLAEAVREIERTITEEDVEADGGAHLFASSAGRV